MLNGIIKRKELTAKENSMEKINHRMYLVFIFLLSQIHLYIL